MSRRALVRLREAKGLAKRARGAQPGNRNRLTHGLYARAFLLRRARTGEILRRSRALIAQLEIRVREIRASSQRKTHRAAVGKPAPLLSLNSLAQPRSEFGFAQFDEAIASVKRRVPCHMTERRERHGAQAASARGIGDKVEQQAAKATALKFPGDRELDNMQRIARDLAAQFPDHAGVAVFRDPNGARGDRRQEVFSAADRFIRHPGEFWNGAKERARRLFDTGQKRCIVRAGHPNGKGRRT